MIQTVHLDLPTTLYQQVKAHAAKTKRSVEAELVAAVEAFLTADEELAGLPLDIADEIAQLPFLDNTHLWQAAQQTALPEKNRRIQELVVKQQAEGLTPAEQQEALQLQQYAHRLMMVRAEAAVLLRARGFDISSLRQPISSPENNPSPSQPQ